MPDRHGSRTHWLDQGGAEDSEVWLVTVAPCRSATQPRKYPLPSSTPEQHWKGVSLFASCSAGHLTVGWGGSGVAHLWRGSACVVFEFHNGRSDAQQHPAPPPPRRPPATLPPLATFVQSHLQANRGSAGRRHCGGVASRLLRIGVANIPNGGIPILTQPHGGLRVVVKGGSLILGISRS